MIENFYTRFILRYPKTILLVLGLVITLLGFFAAKLEIDASAETLMLENDKDLEFSRVITELYRVEDFLVLTFTPKNGDIFAPHSLQTLKKLQDDIVKLPLVDSVTTVLNVPLLQSPAKPVRELLKKIPTLESPDTNMTQAKKELLSSPLYRENLVSKDFKTTALLINLVYDTLYFELLRSRDDLQAKKRHKTITDEEQQKLNIAQQKFKTYRDKIRIESHQNIVAIRAIMDKYQQNTYLHLGGLPMIADDMVTFVKSDLKTFSLVVFALLIIILSILFKQPRWVLIPLTVCMVAVVATSGLLGMFGWEITIVSSNFISLQLIMTMSLVIHLTVKYRELLEKHPDLPQKTLVLQTVTTMAKPSFFVVITTVTGFSSLVLSRILPIINFGWMMSIGVTCSLLVTFIIFPTVVLLLKKKVPQKDKKMHFSFTSFIA
ncbi:MAG: MMPL family transporter, partial [bacterium]